MINKSNGIIEEVSKVVIGKEEVVRKVMVTLLAEGHVLIEDIPGVGKTTLALAFAKAIGLDFKRIQFTSDSVPSDITGFSIYNKDLGNFQYIPGAAVTNLLLADEINRTSSKTQSALLEVMEEKKITVDGNTTQIERPFAVIATQNPVGSAGTQLLPDSQLDRFMVKLSMGYPDFNSQVNILKDRHHSNPLDEVKAIVNKEQFLEMIGMAQKTYISDEIYEYITGLVEATRTHALVKQGVSPRGALALCNMAKAYAFVVGRDYVVPEDIKAVFGDVCGHRLILDPKARISGIDAITITKEIIDGIATPEDKKE